MTSIAHGRLCAVPGLTLDSSATFVCTGAVYTVSCTRKALSRLSQLPREEVEKSSRRAGRLEVTYNSRKHYFIASLLVSFALVTSG